MLLRDSQRQTVSALPYIRYPEKTLASPPQEFPLNAPLSHSEADVSLLSLSGITKAFFTRFPPARHPGAQGPHFKGVSSLSMQSCGVMLPPLLSLCELLSSAKLFMVQLTCPISPSAGWPLRTPDNRKGLPGETAARAGTLLLMKEGLHLPLVHQDSPSAEAPPMTLQGLSFRSPTSCRAISCPLGASPV